MPSRSQSEIRIGIYRSCGIGDAVQLTPLFRQIRADLPCANVTFFSTANVIAILEGCPVVNQTVSFPDDLIRSAAAKYGGFPIWHKISALGTWDIFLNLEPQWRRSLGFPVVRAARKGGLQTRGWKPFRLFDEFLTQHPQGLDRGHASWRYLDLWHKLTGHGDRGFGYDLDHLQHPVCPLPPLPAGFVCLAPGAGNAFIPGEAKRWPFPNWVRLAERIRKSGFACVWLGSSDDARLFPVDGAAVNLMGRIDLRQCYQVINRSVALIGNDSGLLHMALATKARVVGLFGPTNPQRTGPFRNSKALVLKAGFGRVDDSSLTDFSPGVTQEALDAVIPMTHLDFELVASEVAAFVG